MSKHLQQLTAGKFATGRKAGAKMRLVQLQANIALVLVLVIIPTISGVALVA